MLGAGIFAAIGPAAAAAGSGMLVGLGLAGVVALANGMSSARLAAIHPMSGGAYVYGRRQLGRMWGLVAGWAFTVGKVASCAAIALTFGEYAWPRFARPLAVLAVIAFTVANVRGVHKTVMLTRILVTGVLIVLAVVVAGAVFGGGLDTGNLLPLWPAAGARGILRAGALLFFAFAGYARIATLGEEVIDPARTIPRAIPVALGIVLFVYTSVALAAILAAGPGALASAEAPLAVAVGAGNLAALAPVVRVGAALATLGVLLSLLAGVARTVFAMAADGELPRWFERVHPRFRVPHRAELAVGIVVAALAASGALERSIALSAFSVLLYYAITNAAALTVPGGRFLPVVGLAGCLVLAFSLPLASVVLGASLLLPALVLSALRSPATGR